MERNRGLIYAVLDPSDIPGGHQRDLRGHLVVDSSGSVVGNVTALVVDADRGWIRFLLTTVDDVDGPEDLAIAVPVDAIAGLSPGRVQLDRDRDRVLSGPPVRLPVAEPVLWERVLAYYSTSSG